MYNAGLLVYNILITDGRAMKTPSVHWQDNVGFHLLLVTFVGDLC